MSETTTITTTPTGLELREAVAWGSLDLPDAVRVLNPDRSGDGPVIYPWETSCKHPEPAVDCRLVTGRNTHGADWCYSCWMADWERRQAAPAV